jgi:hypothetical protein
MQPVKKRATDRKQKKDSKRQKVVKSSSKPVKTAGAGVRKRTPVVLPVPDMMPDHLTPQLYTLPATAKVRMKPSLVLADGRISLLEISAKKRTPSPFGARMGDHTVAWSSVVDALRARVTGLTLADAIDLIQREHESAVKDYTTPGGAGMRMLAALPDGRERVALLEDAAQRTTDLLENAKKASDPAVFAKALAQHLTFINYLPFATVPAASGRGSVGSGESSRRARVLKFEKEDAPANGSKTVDAVQGKHLRDDLWGMFAFDAALRATDVQVLLDPGLGSTVRDNFDKLEKLKQRLAGAADLLTIGELENEVKKLVDPLKSDPRIPDELITYAWSVLDDIHTRQKLTVMLSMKDRATLQASASAVTDAAAAAKKVVDDLAARAERARTDAPVILAHLLAECQRNAATAYPDTVRASKFLGDDAGEAAANELRDRIMKLWPKVDEGDLDIFLSDVWDAHPGPITPADGHAWVANADNVDLVVTYNTATRTFGFDGRADTPNGIDGMGRHTTSWNAETLSLNGLIAKAKAKTPAEAVLALRAAVLDDLKSDVMELDEYLPVDQLVGGQVLGILQAAAEVLRIADDEKPQTGDDGVAQLCDMATAYLQFRNALPFATVDDGDPGGNSEGADKSSKRNFDSKSLQLAAKTHHEALRDEDLRGDILDACDAAATQIETWLADIVKLAERSKVRPEDLVDADLLKAARAAGDRLKNRQIPELMDDDDEFIDPESESIVTVRTQEHRRVSELAGFDADLGDD